MAGIRWFKMSEALAELGHRVDILTAEHKWRLRRPVVELAPRLRKVPLRKARWDDYDVVKTLFHRGFETLEKYGGDSHPFIISKLGSVVGSRDRAGIYFYGSRREQMFQVQERIHAAARFVTLLTKPGRDLWRACHGGDDHLLLVPGAAETEIPPPGEDPYPTSPLSTALFAGNFYSTDKGSQARAHRTLATKLNRIGSGLQDLSVRLCVLGRGEEETLDAGAVTYLGAVPYRESWNYLHHADAGIVVSAGPFMHNNESTKIYHYLRAGLPVVSESGFPNDDLVRETGHGFLVDPGDTEAFVSAVSRAIEADWDREPARRHILHHHTWRARAEIYDELLARKL